MALVRFLLLALMAWAATVGPAQAAAAVSTASPDTRFRGLLEALAAPPGARRVFVENNFSQAAIEKRGIDELVRLLGVLHEDFGGNRPLSVEARPDRFESLFAFADRDEQVLLTVKFTPPPESLIDGFSTGPAPSARPPGPPPSEDSLPGAVKSLAEASAAEGFSGAVIVARRGAPVFAQAYGLADRAAKRANTLDTPFNLASDNKMFTALVIAQLVEQGKLDWDDRVGEHLPEWPQATVRDQVTIAQLLSHTSGLGQFWGPAHAARLDSLGSVTDYAELIRADAPTTTPGTAFNYSNNGFVLLGLIAERVSGRDYYQLVRENIYRRAGMTASDHYRRDDSASGRAIGYDREGQANTARLALRGSPAGGGYASAHDLLKFATALQEGRLVSAPTLARMTTAHARMGGPSEGYGYGFGVFQHRQRHYGHDGGSPGAHASFEVFPDSGYVVIVLANGANGPPDLARRIGAMVLGLPIVGQSRPPAPD